ncbi:M56 family metallopeptidase [Clostridium estertheticum]|uniref:M56 family metallopeptidase n=1 Tax=Clostridium estertheticum TaxID=238834 RepID=UPI00124DA10D|nr:M56 family metallopeptidase [Clostridium estertheticum]MBZ9618271.1 stage II sporulation protein P [Clostridium estertheticum subsp. laramiense]WAG76228.1 stage II sporulation protein P [Clostridium estertheticum]
MNLLNFFEKIVLSSLIGSVIVLIILIIKGIFRNKLNFTFHYYIWLILIIKLIIPIGPQSPLNVSTLNKNFHVQTQIAQTNSSTELTVSDFGASNLISKVPPLNKDVIVNTMSKPLAPKLNIEEVFCFIWLFGFVLSIGILVKGYKKLNNIVRYSLKNVNSTHGNILNECMKDMNIRTEVELTYSDKLSSPSLCGPFKPKILIPINVATNICNEEFKHIIMHELTHLKRNDLIVNWTTTLLSTIYWFNPILLYGFYKMKQDCEISCDGQVISYLGYGKNMLYGNTIIKVLKLGGKGNRLIGTTSMVLNRFEMKRRIIMISKYNKINIKGVLLGAVLVVIIGGFGIAINTSSISSDKNIAKATTLQVKTPVATSKNLVKNTSSVPSLSNIKKSATNTTNPIVPFSADIVIYNSHPDEAYPSGVKVTDVGALISDKLVKEGFNSHFIKINPPKNYNKSYQITRDIIKKNVKNYPSTILLDIHREDVATKIKNDKTNKILFVVTEANPRYKANKKFVDSLIGNIKNTNGIQTVIYPYQYGISYYNEDLSNNSALIEIGNNMSSNSDIEACVNALVSALKNTQRGSSN